jgi:hypothetical protein
LQLFTRNGDVSIFEKKPWEGCKKVNKQKETLTKLTLKQGARNLQ